MTTWLAGNKIRGTSIDRLNTTGIGNKVGGWKELARTTLGSATTPITVSNLPNKRYYMILSSVDYTTTSSGNFILNNDTGTNFAYRRSINGGADTTSAGDNTIVQSPAVTTNPDFGVNYLANYSTKEKVSIGHICGNVTTGVGTPPQRLEVVGKWANTTNPINRIDFNATTPNFTTGSEIVVLGWDPTDTHSNNFWEELASEVGTGATTLNASFTSKKYLWIQAYIARSAGANDTIFRVGKTTIDTGSNYAQRKSANGGADATLTSQSGFTAYTGSFRHFFNIFISNISADEKLIIMHEVDKGTDGAGNATNRVELVGKWVNTTDQIDIVGFYSGGADTLSSTSILKVWGAN